MMYSGDEFYDDETRSGLIDPYAAADVRLDQLKDTSSCAKCGSREPARIERNGCSDCTEFDRCAICRRWVGEVYSAPYLVELEGKSATVCQSCYVSFDVRVPLDYREAV